MQKNHTPPGFLSPDTSLEKARRIPSLNLGLPQLPFWYHIPETRIVIIRPRDLSGNQFTSSSKR